MGRGLSAATTEAGAAASAALLDSPLAARVNGTPVEAIYPAARPTGTPPRCRQCRATCHIGHIPTHGGTFDRLCAACNSILAGGSDADAVAPDCRRGELPIIPYWLSEPFDIPALRHRTVPRKEIP